MTKEDIHIICKEYEITNYTINDDLSIDVTGYVNIYNRALRKLPLRFRDVTGWFDCSDNNLTSLEGAPREVGGYFDCSYNQLTSLDGAPREVGGYFDCSGNLLESLECSQSKVGGFFSCWNNPLESIKGIPLNLSEKQLSLPDHFTYSDYLAYCRNLKFKKLLK